MSTPTEEQIAFLTHIFTSGYQRGHEDTVEARFTDVARSEYSTFFRQDVEELTADLAPALLGAARENLRLREEVTRLQKSLEHIAKMPERDQDDAHRLRYFASLAMDVNLETNGEEQA